MGKPFSLGVSTGMVRILPQSSDLVTKHSIDAAYEQIHANVIRTPIIPALRLSERCGCRVHFKLENVQRTGSFKERGALNKLLSLEPAERNRGVVAASAGNHAQGVAYHAQRLGIPATIIMPQGSPLVKVVATQNFGARVILDGDTYDDACRLAEEMATRENFTLVHAFRDPLVVSGQGTIGREILEDELGRQADVILCPIGGGGLIAGIASYIKAVAPRISIIGVQAAVYPSMAKALEAGQPVKLPTASSLADGISVKEVGKLNFDIVKRLVDDVLLVGEDEIARAVLHLLEVDKITVEGAGAVSVAPLLGTPMKRQLVGKTVLCIISGGHIDVNVLSKIITRGLASDGRIFELTIRVRDIPGALTHVLGIVRELQSNILHIDHHRFGVRAPFGHVDVSLTLETKGHLHILEIERVLCRHGYLV